MFFVKLAILFWIVFFVFRLLSFKMIPTDKMMDKLTQEKRESIYKSIFPVFSFLTVLHFVAFILAIINSFVALIWFLFIR